ncbi:MAG TPA: hypothetical protein VNA44_12550 [Burkholderiaceae bacterium]|nr:hypothetical protein [Burkholderiaceae bacterium]
MELDFVAHVRDQVRTLFKIRCERTLPSESSKPPFGTKLFCADIRMTVRSGMSDQLWRWLLDQGWREVPVQLDRRRYKDIPSAYVTRLIDSEANDERARVLEAAIANAQYRPRMTRDGRIIPVRKNRNTKSE